MEILNNIKDFFTNLEAVVLIDIWIAVGIILVFKILSSILAYLIIKIFKMKEKENKKIRQNAFYKPLKSFISLLGIYIAILFLRAPLNIDSKVIDLITKIFKILTILLISKGFLGELTVRSGFIAGLKRKLKSDNLDDSSIKFILGVLKGLVYIITGFIIIAELGYDLSGLVTGLGITGVIVTLAAQDTAKNLLGGFVIFLDKPFKVGDYISISNYEGTVEDITFRSTCIRTLENSILRIPNSELASMPITNYSAIKTRRYKTNLVLELGTKLEDVEKLRNQIIELLQHHENILNDTICVRFQNIADDGYEVVVIAYTNLSGYYDFLKVKEEVNYSIMQILHIDNIKLAYKTQTIHIANK